MKWHVDDVPFLLLHLPQALHDLMHHEDAAMVQKHLVNVNPRTDSAAPRHHIATDIPPRISIEKSLDPMAQRSVQNIGLLLHDYIQQLPDFEITGGDAEKLIEHWRKIMLEYPERLASGHSSNWLHEKTKAYWQDRLSGRATVPTLSAAAFLDAWDDWERAAGAGHTTGAPAQLQAMQLRQWQDLVIRSRLHREKAGQYGITL